MAEAVLIVGLSTGPIWGCPDTEYGAGQSLEVENSGETQTLPGGDGEPIAAAFHTNQRKVNYNAKIKGSLPAFKRGMPLIVGEEKGFLDTWTIRRQNNDFADVELSLFFWTNGNFDADFEDINHG